MNTHSASSAFARDRRPVARTDDGRPKNLRLISIRLPLPALVSILHRVSGVLLFLCLPVALWLLQRSLASPAGYAEAAAVLASPPARLVELVFIWSFMHHFIAGLRHLALDLHFGLELKQARLTARLTLVLSLLCTVLAGVWLW